MITKLTLVILISFGSAVYSRYGSLDIGDNENYSDDTVNDEINYDPDSVDLIVNIALSLFDSLQEYSKHLDQDQDKFKVKFKPKLVIEDIQPLYDDMDQPEENNEELREIIDPDNIDDNLKNHRDQSDIADSEAEIKKILLQQYDTGNCCVVLQQ